MDLLRWPVAGALARRRHARLLLQLPLLAVAVAIVVHGLTGPQLAPRNLATVLGWVHYRGLLIVAILAVGNLFCAGCPMILARDTGRRLLHPAWRWPRVLRNKWPAIVLFVAVLFAYELFDLWSLPAATAWLVLGYFAAAILVDVFFAGASFCKYVCPIGQFSFVASTMAPAELRVRNMATCGSCRTVDCIRGRREPSAPVPVVLTRAQDSPAGAAVGLHGNRGRVTQRGCELGLFLPGKVGNLDCTLCLDCVHACPHDNIALTTRVPGDELIDTGRRSGIGWLTRRSDLAALAVVFTFGALLNAFAMTGPASAAEGLVARLTGVEAPAVTLGVLFAASLLMLPLALLGLASLATRALTGAREPAGAIAVRFAYALVPFGVGVWTAHYGFHLLTGALTLVPVAQSAAVDLAGRAILGEPLWTWVGVQPGAVFPLQVGCILLGAIGSLATAYRIPERTEGRSRGVHPWALLILLLAALAVWIVAQPMDMRGVGLPG